MQDFRKLKVWNKSHQLTMALFKISKTFPPEHRFMINQVRHSAVSISANLAEGCGRGNDADFKRFVQIAMGSASELEYHLLLLKDLKLLDEKNIKYLMIN
jgi:four helix bundle protein